MIFTEWYSGLDEKQKNIAPLFKTSCSKTKQKEAFPVLEWAERKSNFRKKAETEENNIWSGKKLRSK